MRTPTSTYRLQFRDGMTFEKAAGLIGYLKALGISHLYASPIFAATRGSTHGYDVIDPNLVDPALGGRDAFEKMARQMKDAGLNLLLDIVPNHMAASLENPWWRDVVEWGRSSRHAAYFDIDWEQRLTLPFLGDDFDKALSAGDIRLSADREKGFLALDCYGQHYPLNPSTYSAIFRDSDLEIARSALTLAMQAAAEAEEIFHAALRALLAGPSGADIDAILAERSADHAFMMRLHDMQSWRLMNWRLAPEGLSYRRFFEITGLVGTRVEDPDVFQAIHGAVFAMLDEGLIDGLRIDHVDGLADPAAYLKQLRERIGPDTYLVVEKILGPGETLPPEWPVQGTTGYEFITALGHLLADRAGVEVLEKAYGALGREPKGSPDMRRDAKQLMIGVNFAGEVATLRRLALRLLARDGETVPDEGALGRAIEELLIAFPVYRTYGTAAGLPERDGRLLAQIADEARGRLGPAEQTALDAILGLLTEAGASESNARFRTRFQQLTGPLMAKSLEDTLFFRHNAFLAFNEVGGEIAEPDTPEVSFHDLMAQRLETEPLALSATATHDTKRGEDARARLMALSEDPQTWIGAVERWSSRQRDATISVDGNPAPEPEVEWMIYQALAGAWPQAPEPMTREQCEALETRLHQFLEKAMREAKRASNWSAVNEAYEKAVKAYASRLLAPANHAFREDFASTLAPYMRAGQLNSLSQTILKLTAPGIPDIYQGSERTDFSFVDPDNRRLPDFTLLARELERHSASPEIPWNDDGLADGSIKQLVIARLLHLRDEHKALFEQGTYQPLGIEGENRAHLAGFLRRYEGRTLVVVVPRLTLKLALAEPGDTQAGRTRVLLPDDMLDHPYHDIFTGRDIRFPERDAQVSGFAAAGYSLMLSRAG